MDNYSFAERVAEVPDAGIGSIMRYAAKYNDTISLGQGAPQFPTPPFVYDELYKRSQIDVLLGSYNSVNDKIQLPLKELLVKNIREKYLFTPNISEIYLTVGGLGGLYATMMAILEKGDEVIYFNPSYPIHLSQLALVQATPVYVPVGETDVRKYLTPKTKAVILTNPNNPTGTVLTKSQVTELAEIVLEHNLYLILDEAYEYLTYEQPLFSPMLLPELRPRIILSKSFSKEYAMTGWRIGYLWSSAEIINKIHSVHQYFSLNPATISIVAATVVLSDLRGRQAMEYFKSEITKSREVICKRMDSLTKIFSYEKPNGAFYLFPKIIIPGISALDFAHQLIDQVGVITIPGDSMGPAGKEHIRISFSASPDVINRAFDRIDSFVKDNY